MTFTLALLGTDTNYTPKPDEGNRFYFGETLSVIAGSIAQPDGQEISVEGQTNTAHGENASVIQGPDTLGYGVGDRIARAVLEILIHIIKHQDTDIKIIAHSRGAVEAILVAHELQRIVGLFANTNEVTIADFCKSADRTDRVVKTDYSTFYAMNNEPLLSKLKEVFEPIKNNRKLLAEIRLAIFNIDPVPGGNSVIGNVFSTRWEDPRFYTIPKIVRSYEQCIYLHENSRSFKPIIPVPESSENTKFHLFTLPGHHGTGSGNLYDHEATPASVTQLGDKQGARRKTGLVQDLLVLKIVDFLRANHQAVVFTAKEELVAKGIDPELVALIHIPQEESRKVQLARYLAIFEHFAEYEKFRQSHYAAGLPAWLTKEQGISDLCWRTVVADRIVHHKAHTDSYLANVVHPVPNYVNQDHFNLQLSDSMSNIFDIDDQDTSFERLEKMITKLVQSCRHADSPVESATQSMLGNMRRNPAYLVNLQTLFSQPQILENVFSELINQVVEAYLDDRIETKLRVNVLQKTDQLVNDLKAYAQEAEDKKGGQLANRLLSPIETGLTKAFSQRLKQLFEVSYNISENLQQSPVSIGLDLLSHFEAVAERMQTEKGLKDPELADRLAAQIESLKLSKRDGWEFNDLLAFTQQQSGDFSGEMNRDPSKPLAALNGAYHTQLMEILADKLVETNQKLNRYNSIHGNIREVLVQCRDCELYLGGVERVQHLLAEDFITQSQRERAQLQVLNSKIIKELALYIVAKCISPIEYQAILYDVLQEYTSENRSFHFIDAIQNEIKLAISEHQQMVEIWQPTSPKPTMVNAGTQATDNTLQEIADTQLSLLAQQNEEIQSLKGELNTLTQMKQNEIATLKQQVSSQAQEILRLNAPIEKEAYLVIVKLKALTIEYLAHLNKVKASAEKNDALIADKITVISKLNELLDSTTSEIASLDNPNKNQAVLVVFYTQLNQANQNGLGAHRDVQWKRYISNTAKILGIILTGILPGLAILGILSVKGHSAKFWQSHGTEFIEKANIQKPEKGWASRTP